MLLAPSISRPRPRLPCVIAGGVALALLLGPAAAWSAALRIDPAQTHLVVRTYKDGIGSALAHDHVIEATEVSGAIEYDPSRPEASSIVIETRTASLRVDDPAARRRFGVPGELSESDRAEVSNAMRAPDQLDVVRYPTIRFASTRVISQGEGRLQVTGELTIRGATREVTFPATVALDGDGLQARATLRLLQSSFGYRPYSALLGVIRNKDEVTLDVDLVARP